MTGTTINTGSTIAGGGCCGPQVPLPPPPPKNPCQTPSQNNTGWDPNQPPAQEWPTYYPPATEVPLPTPPTTVPPGNDVPATVPPDEATVPPPAVPDPSVVDPSDPTGAPNIDPAEAPTSTAPINAAPGQATTVALAMEMPVTFNQGPTMADLTADMDLLAGAQKQYADGIRTGIAQDRANGYEPTPEQLAQSVRADKLMTQFGELAAWTRSHDVPGVTPASVHQMRTVAMNAAQAGEMDMEPLARAVFNVRADGAGTPAAVRTSYDAAFGILDQLALMVDQLKERAATIGAQGEQAVADAEAELARFQDELVDLVKLGIEGGRPDEAQLRLTAGLTAWTSSYDADAFIRAAREAAPITPAPAGSVAA